MESKITTDYTLGEAIQAILNISEYEYKAFDYIRNKGTVVLSKQDRIKLAEEWKITIRILDYGLRKLFDRGYVVTSGKPKYYSINPKISISESSNTIVVELKKEAI